jgi:hypothetical protein
VAEKGGVHVDEELKDRKQRKVVSLLDKVEVLGKLGRRMKISALCTQVGGSFHNKKSRQDQGKR